MDIAAELDFIVEATAGDKPTGVFSPSNASHLSYGLEDSASFPALGLGYISSLLVFFSERVEHANTSGYQCAQGMTSTISCLMRSTLVDLALLIEGYTMVEGVFQTFRCWFDPKDAIRFAGCKNLKSRLIDNALIKKVNPAESCDFSNW